MLGQATLDSQHELLFGLIGELQNEISAARGPTALADVLQRLFMYAVVHFATEDRLMMESDYPEVLSHRAQHESAMTNLKRLEEECQAGVPSAPQNILRFMESWATDHIPNADRRLAEHLSKHGRA